ncbi:hypothetical protein [Marinitoga lauensis]|uniref:hypothetical protein n=1 Tax=Marinitoga lauensis TaxID=2201189 RepID=UPI00101158FA|nr:hypothetical protein [Marinitoga lauensis]
MDINKNELIITDGKRIMIYNIENGELMKSYFSEYNIDNIKYIEDNKIAFISNNIIYICEESR